MIDFITDECFVCSILLHWSVNATDNKPCHTYLIEWMLRKLTWKLHERPRNEFNNG